MPPAAAQRHASPYRLPPPGRPLRVAFVGQRTYYEHAALHHEVPGLSPTFLDFRDPAEAGTLREDLEELAPHVVVVFRPESIPAGLFADLPAAVLGFATAPLPKSGEAPYAPLEWNLSALRQADRANFDRVVSVYPTAWDSAAGLLPLWRCMPLPVDDRLFRPVRRSHRPARIAFIGYSTLHREHSLLRVKHELDIGHYAYGLLGDELERVLDATDVGLCLHGEPWVETFEHTALVHLAAGHLLVAEPLVPTYGLEPGIDFLEVPDADELGLRLHQLAQHPDSYDRIRVRGRDKAEQYRASRLWPEVIGDLLADVDAFGTDRP
jgi:hypothetical protein